MNRALRDRLKWSLGLICGLVLLIGSANAQERGGDEDFVGRLVPQTQLIQDPGFETSSASGANAFWASTSTNFGTSICGNCGTIHNPRPHTGIHWVLFGGSVNPETGTVSQSVPFPNGGPATLSYWLWIGATRTGDVMNVQVDGTTVQSWFSPPGPEAGYTQRTLNLNAFANGAAHIIKFQFVGRDSEFNLDDIQLNTTIGANISGRVLRPSGRGITHAKIVISGGTLTSPLTFFTDRRGNYTSSELTSGTAYTVTVSQRRFTFNPSSAGVSVTGTGTSTQNFTSTQ